MRLRATVSRVPRRVVPARAFGQTSDVDTPAPARPWPTRRRFLTAFVALGVLATASSTRAKPVSNNERPLRIFVASSVSDVVRQVAEATLAPNQFQMNVAASSTLARQALAGAPFDLFVSANEHWAQTLAEEGLVAGIQPLASNSVVVATAAETTLATGDFGPAAIAAAERQAPLGMATEEVVRALGDASLRERLVRAPSARAALEWVATKDVSSGFLFASDVATDARVKVAWALPSHARASVNVVGAAATNAPPAAKAFLRTLGGQNGQSAFRAHHFAAAMPTVARAPGTSPQVDVGAAVARSLAVALFALLGAAPMAVAAGYFMARRRRRGRAILSTVLSTTFLLPLALPPVVTGWLLLVALGKRGLGTGVPFTFWACVIAALVIALPLVTLTARSAFEAVDPRLEELAMTLGAPPARTFRTVTLPLAFPGLLAGLLLAFARGLGEYGATVVVAGNTEGQTRTLSLAVDALLQTPGAEGVGLLVGFSVALTAVVVVAFEALNRWQRRRMEGGR